VKDVDGGSVLVESVKVIGYHNPCHHEKSPKKPIRSLISGDCNSYQKRSDESYM